MGDGSHGGNIPGIAEQHAAFEMQRKGERTPPATPGIDWHVAFSKRADRGKTGIPQSKDLWAALLANEIQREAAPGFGETSLT